MIGENIRRYRESAGLTQRQLAQALEVSPSAVGMYEQGRRAPDARTLAAIASTLGVTVDALLRDPSAVSSVDGLIETLRRDLCEDTVMFNGAPLTAEDVDAVLEAMKLGARIALQQRKEKSP